MRAPIAHLSVVMFIVAAAAGCSSSAPARFYTLDSTAIPQTAPVGRETVMVGPVSVPAAVDQPQFVIQVAPNRVDVDEFNRWAAPLNDGIARAVAGDLAAQLETPNVVTAPAANFNPTYQVTIDVQRFESIKGQAALLEAVWAVHNVGSGLTRTGRTVTRQPVQSDSFEALAAAHSRALARMSADIAAAIRLETANTP